MIPEKDEMAVFLQLMSTKDQETKDQVLSNFFSPAQNFIYADREGHIGLNVQGSFPQRAEGQGREILDGSLSTNAWGDLIPEDRIAKASDPAQGYLASANQRSTSEAYPYHYNGGFDDYRGRTINKFLMKTDKFSVEDMKKLQGSNYSLFTEEALQALRPLIDSEALSSSAQDAYGALEEWNFYFDKEKKAPIIFDLWWKELYSMIWDEYEGKNANRPEIWRTIELLSTEDGCFDLVKTEKRENSKDIARMSFEIAVNEYDSLMAKGVKDYGEYKGFQIPNLMNIPAFSRAKLYAGGHWSCLNSLRENSSVAPSWRMIVDMGQEQKAYGIFPGGQSGNPGSPFYDNTVDDWVEGNYYTLQFPNSPDQLSSVSHQVILKNQ